MKPKSSTTNNSFGAVSNPVKAGKPKMVTMSSMGTGGNKKNDNEEEDDDPMGRIPTAPVKVMNNTAKEPTHKEVSIKSNQFETHEMSTSYDPPKEEDAQIMQKMEQEIYQPDDAATQRMIRRMEEEMTKGR